MKRLLSLSFLLFCIAVSAQQQRYENKDYGFAMDEPDGWLWANNDDLKQNLGKLDLDNAKLLKIIQDHKGSLLLMSFYKYDPMTKAGLIPAVQVNVREMRNKDFSVFKSYIVKSANHFKDLYPDYEFIDEPQEVKVNRIKSIYFSGKFTMKTQMGETFRVRSRTYVIPHGDFYFQIVMTDGVFTEDCSKLFEELIESIKIKK
ncbi:hypothetical protein OGH69_07440 [Flavobacterium sp. MFBS3-15]|uniref:hypothetical protein n=1 Tax=Flavobacterium sp. MFBS3-15 TaxID=2989816 RepID=UPI0022368292|nr:hypothetical protein [Flavobacterium sp. MFBS3-15]MCW4468789.1 hypothetical protein [Flavobacterium sp. MFBS3-15]